MAASETMMPQVSGRRAVAGWLLLALPVVMLCLLRLPSLFEPHWYGDEGYFAAVATDVLHGDTLYEEAFDSKPPLIFITYASVQWLAGPSMFAIRLAAAAAALIALASVILFAARAYGRGPAVAAGALFATVIGTPVIEANLALTEIFMIAPVSAGMLVALIASERDETQRVWWYLAAGLLLGIATNYKQVAVFDAAALAFVAGCAERRFRLQAVGAIGIGVAAPTLIAMLAAVLTGAFGEYWYAVVTSTSDYNDAATPLRFFERALRYAPAAVAALALLARRHDVTLRRDLALAWLAFAAAGAFASPFAWPHYLVQIVPAFALVFGSLVRVPRVSFSPRPAFAALLLIYVGWLSWDIHGDVIRDRAQMDVRWYYSGFLDRARGDLDSQEFAARFDGSTVLVDDVLASIDQHRGAGAHGDDDSLFMWGDVTWLYARGDLHNPTRYPSAWLATWIPHARDSIIDDLRDDPPEFVLMLDGTPPFDDLAALLDERYEQVDAGNGWRLFAPAER